MTARHIFTLVLLLLGPACTDPAPAPEPIAEADPVPRAEALVTAAPSAPAPESDSALAEPVAGETGDATEAPAPAPPPAPAAPPADGRYAVLVGIDDYPGDDSDLPSGAQDVAAMRALLVGRFGYRPEHVLTLADRRATRGAIRRAIRDHLGQADASALLYVSGHGIRLDANMGRADAERDGRDEALYVWADDGRHSALVADDEVGAWMGALTARHAVVVLDACHSGTGARDDGRGPVVKEVKLADVDARLDPAAPWRQPVRAGGRPVVLLAAARDREVAFAGVDGAPSLFTDALADVLADVPPSTALADAMRRVAARVRAASRRMGSEHRPQMEGAAGLTLADLFSLPR